MKNIHVWLKKLIRFFYYIGEIMFEGSVCKQRGRILFFPPLTIYLRWYRRFMHFWAFLSGVPNIQNGNSWRGFHFMSIPTLRFLFSLAGFRSWAFKNIIDHWNIIENSMHLVHFKNRSYKYFFPYPCPPIKWLKIGFKNIY